MPVFREVEACFTFVRRKVETNQHAERGPEGHACEECRSQAYKGDTNLEGDA